MLWFRYRWVLTFSRGLCIKIIRAGDSVKRLSNEIDYMFKRPQNIYVVRGILQRIVKLIDILDDLIFSASALLYREEKDLIRFSKRVESTAARLIGRLKGEKGKLNKDLLKLKGKKKELSRKLKVRKQTIEKDEKKKKEIVGLLHEVTSFIEEMDHKIHNMHLEAKSQASKTFNIHKLRENVIIRSNFRLGELTGRKGIEAGILVKRIRKKLKYFGSKIKKGKNLNEKDVRDLLKYCRMETDDLKRVFMFSIQLAERVSERLQRVGKIISTEPKLRSLVTSQFIAKKRLNILRRDIVTQHRRLDNEFKKGGFTPIGKIQKEIKEYKKAA